MKRTVLVLVLLTAVTVFYSLPQKVEADTVMKVIDGDTVEISPASGGAFFTCRLYGIDAPEPGQPHGQEAANILRKLLALQNVDVTFKHVKSYTREVCLVKLQGTDVGLEMVRRGHAWAYNPNPGKSVAGRYGDAEKKAREKKLGLWKDKDPQPPWEFRKRK